MTRVAAAREKGKSMPRSMNQNCSAMMIQRRAVCSTTRPRLLAFFRNERPCRKLSTHEATRRKGILRTIHAAFDRMKNKAISAAVATAAINHEASLRSCRVAEDPSGTSAANNAAANSRISAIASRKRSTTIVATEPVSGTFSRRVSQTGRAISPALPNRKMAENPMSVIEKSGRMGTVLRGASRICHRIARNQYVRRVSTIEAASQPAFIRDRLDKNRGQSKFCPHTR